jgi:hypothetical protein
MLGGKDIWQSKENGCIWWMKGSVYDENVGIGSIKWE